MCCFDGCYTVSFAIIILVNVGCGICVSATGAFFNEGGNIWAFIIFGLYVLFSGWMIYFIIQEVYFNKGVSSSLNWICGMCTVVTIGVIVVVYIVVKPVKSDPVIVAMVVASVNLFVLTCVASCYTDFLRLGLGERRQARQRRLDVERAFPIAELENKGEEGGERTMDQSLARIVHHVQNNPTNKTYRMYAAGSETPFEVVM